MDRFLFIKEFDKELYSLCCEIVKLQNESNVDALIKCRQALEYLTTRCGATEYGLFARIREINQSGILDAYITSLFNRVKKNGDDAVHIQKIENAIVKEAEIKRLRGNISYSVDVLYEILIWFEIKICSNAIKDNLLDDNGRRLAKKYIQKQENSLIDPLVINSFIPPDAEENVDYRERDVFETREEYKQRFLQYQKLISEQRITIGYVVIDNYDDITGVALPPFYLNKNLNINGEKIAPPNIDAIIINKNNLKDEYKDNEFEIVVNLQIKKDFYSPIELNLDTIRIQVSDTETCPFEYIDFQNSRFPEYLLPVGTAYPIRSSYNIDTMNLVWECNLFSYLPKNTEISLNTIVDRNVAKNFCSSREIFKVYGVLSENVKEVKPRLLASQKCGSFYIADSNVIVNVNSGYGKFIKESSTNRNCEEYKYTPFYGDIKKEVARIKAQQERARAEEIRKAQEKARAEEARMAQERARAEEARMAQARLKAEYEEAAARLKVKQAAEETRKAQEEAEKKLMSEIENGNISYKKNCFEIPNGTRYIGFAAFKNFTSLTKITIPDSVTSIGRSAFAYCASLTDITIPDSVTSITRSAFAHCTSLTDITIPKSVRIIGTHAFENCTSLTKITISDNVISIGGNAFAHCTSLTDITIPYGVTSIDESVFFCCTSLTKITIPDSVISIGGSAFKNCTSLTDIKISDGVTVIADRTFQGCSSLESITIPESVTSIGKEAFVGCGKLKIVYINGALFTKFRNSFPKYVQPKELPKSESSRSEKKSFWGRLFGL